MSSLVGRTLGQYEVIDVLGRGGMATVYLGRQASINRNVAIKVLPPHPALDEAFKQRFQLEATTIGNLQNPNILPLYDYGTFDDVVYLVMQHVDGGTLEDIIEIAPISITDVEKLIRPIASGLDYAHNRGIIHRDIKPSNILMQDGHPLLADFGMVKMATGNSNLTGTSIVGTPSYMAPEQGQGLEIDHRVDIYALAAMAYELLTGKQPFSGTTPMQMILAHINNPVPDVREVRSDLSEEIARVIKQGLAKNPDERYQSAGDFAEALSRAIHRNDESLYMVKKNFPVGTSNQAINQPASTSQTIAFDQNSLTQANSTDPNLTSNQQPSQIIVRDSVNPIILMGGFGLIALVIVIVAVLLINNDNNGGVVNNAPTDNPEIVIAATDAPTDVPALVPTVQGTFGEVRFSTENTFGDRVEVRLQGIAPPQGDADYVAWLTNTATDETINIGRVLVDAFGEGTITFTDNEGRLLPANFNSVIITSEDDDDTEVPVGDIVYRGTLPIAVSDGLMAIFVASEDGLNGGSLLDGAMTESGFASQHAGLAAGSSNIGGLRSHAEHTINILRGEREDYDGSGSGTNPGRGIGVFFFIDAVDTALEAATLADGASVDLQRNAEFIRVCTQNVRDWAEEIVQLEITMIAGESLEAVLDETAQSTTLADQLRSGVDLNENGLTEAFEGECGLDQIPDFGLQFARIDILEATP
ncbi:MAG: serine/threonine-protein kinase [Phototrophicaceae bacterium]